MKNTFTKNEISPKINVVLFTQYSLIHDCIGQLLESNEEINVTNVEFEPAGLLKSVSQTKPHIVLLCLLDEIDENIKLIPKILKASAKTRIVILADPNDLSDQTKALKLGASGIIGMNQNVRCLTRAVRQVYEGETWLSQKLIHQLINGSSINGAKKTYNKIDDLTNRELEVIEKIAQGLKNKEISQKLYISEATVRHHLSSIYSKLHVDDRLNLVIYAYQNGLTEKTQQRSKNETLSFDVY